MQQAKIKMYKTLHEVWLFAINSDFFHTLFTGVSGGIIFLGLKLKKEDISFRHVLFVLFTGAVSSSIVGEAICEGLQIEGTKSCNSIIFLSGLLGILIFQILIAALLQFKNHHLVIVMDILASVFTWINAELPNILRGIIQKYFGNGNSK